MDTVPQTFVPDTLLQTPGSSPGTHTAGVFSHAAREFETGCAWFLEFFGYPV